MHGNTSMAVQVSFATENMGFFISTSITHTGNKARLAPSASQK